MTPLERSRFAASALNEDSELTTQPLGDALDSARQWVAQTRENIAEHHGWTTGLCECYSDLKSCCAVMVCEATVAGQLYERLWQREGSCVVIASILWVGSFGSLLVNYWDIFPPCTSAMLLFDAQLEGGGDANGDGTVTGTELRAALDLNNDGNLTYGEVFKTVDSASSQYDECVTAFYNSPAYYCASVLGFVFFCGMCVLTMAVRRRVRERDQIPATVCAAVDDCACVCCCLMCTQCQIMRHEGLVGSRYKLLSPDGTSEFAEPSSGRSQMV